jgi:hypothetical protein
VRRSRACRAGAALGSADVEMRRGVRAAFRWLRDKYGPGAEWRGGSDVPTAHYLVFRSIQQAARADVRYRDARGLPRLRRFVHLRCGFSIRCTSWGRAIVTDSATGCHVSTDFGVL